MRLPSAGEYTDAETGFQYLRARYYDPATAQFLSRDPAEDSTRAPYSYVDGNPLNGTDPLGLFCLLGHVNGNSGRCRGTNVATDLKVAGVGLSVVALSVGTLGLAAPALTVEGVGLAEVSLGTGVGA